MIPTEQTVESWGRLSAEKHLVLRPSFLDEARAIVASGQSSLLARGQGRSYGDVGMNSGGRLIVTDLLNHVISADWKHGLLRAEAGITLDEVLRICVPHGWFLPVTPGTKFVSLGGAVANDVHGKNHEVAGTFGCHVTRIGLARSSGETLTLSRDENFDLFAATIGGLGLSGLILWVEVQLVPIRSAFMDSETLVIANLSDFFRIAEESRDWPYTVAWVDCLATGSETGRGFFIRARHAETDGLEVHSGPRCSLPFDMPGFVVNARTISLFNGLYRNRPWALGHRRVHYDAFFFPLDSIGQWNRFYGRQGFFQHQSVAPMMRAPETIRTLLNLMAEQGEGSFLIVLKLLGDRNSPGILSFPMAGATLAVDFPNKGGRTRDLLARMERVVIDAGGRLYPAKDATMSVEAFRASYPRWREIEAARDPAITSDFWRRMAKGGA